MSQMFYRNIFQLFTALADMEEVFETESVLIANLEGYIQAQEEKIDILKQKMKEYQREHAEAEKDVSAYLLNPINAYLLTKRLTSDWKDVDRLMTTDVGLQFVNNITEYREVLKFPTDEDLLGAANALIRLQDTYNLDTASVARGILNGVQYSTEMSSDDCFEIGRQMYNNRDYHHTIMWMTEAINRLNNDSRLPRSDVLEYLAFSTFKEGNVQSALDMTNELLTMVPDHQRARGNKFYYEKELAKLNEKSVLRGDDGSADVPIDKSLEFQHSNTGPYTYDLPERSLYELACRGELKPDEAFLSKLSCKYVNNDVPFLRLAPLKLEQVSHDPYIVVYHDVMYDREIEVIKKIAKPRFKRATVQNHKTGELETAHYRISKSAWLKEEEHQVVRSIVQRTADMTGLTMETAEELQVVNYGIGGHYEPHYVRLIQLV
jgi:prolyl 4-hydroxylase